VSAKSTSNSPASKQRRRGFDHWQLAAKTVVIVVAVGLAYLPALRAGFVWDDQPLITANPLLQSFSGLAEIWSGARTADYFPLTNTIFWIESHLFDGHAAGYHALNILLQSANALLVWAVLRRLEIPGAWLAGLIFGIHPIHAESVAWISELKNLLSMFFFLVSLLCFFEIEGKRVLSGSVAYVASLFFFLLALLSKTQVVFLPVVLLLCAWWRGSSSLEKNNGAGGSRAAHRGSSHSHGEMIRTWPFFLIAVAFGLLTLWFQNRGIGEEEIVLGSFGRRFANAGMAVWWYAGKVLAPIRLMTVYPSWRFDSPRAVEWLPLVALIGLMSILWRWRDRWTHSFLFALAYFVVALVPVLGFVRMAYPRSGTLVADHFQYFADISLIALFSAGVARLLESRRRWIKIVTGAVVTLLLGAMGSYTWGRTKIYRNEETLWQDNFSKNPDAWQGHNRIGQLFFDQGKFAEAAQHFERVIELKPELPDNYNSLGLAYCRLERFEEGIVEYRKALQLKGEKSSTAKSAGVATMRTNLANALTLTANNLIDSGQALLEQDAMIAAEADRKAAMERYEEAISEYEKALELEPEHPAIHRNLGLVLIRLGRYDEAVAHLQTVLRLVPNEPTAREALDTIERQRQ
jgi:Flp pilus assembly protein TadD